jgi:hypothetical protein
MHIRSMALSITLKKDDSLMSVSNLKCLCTLLKMNFLGAVVQIFLLFLYCNYVGTFRKIGEPIVGI